MQNYISNKERFMEFTWSYAVDAEWQWYLSGDRNIC